MTVRAVLAPLVRGATYRRGLYLLLGAVLLLPYLLLGEAFRQVLTAGVPGGVGVLLLAVTVVIAGAPAFLRATRAVEIVVARGLLGVELPDPPSQEPSGVALRTRLRTAVWFAGHLLTGGAVALATLIVLPMALVFVVARIGLGGEVLTGMRLGPLDEGDTGWLSLIGIGLLIALIYLVAGLGAVAARAAPALLGPSVAERIAALEARAGELAQRNRLARELHDSVGHALSVTTLQAAAAREVLDTDPEFVRRALRAVEETGRAAMTDLDHVLGLLREDGRAATVPQPTLANLDRLVADARAAATEVEVELRGPVAELPPAVSREGFRIVQESLTNAVRHAGRAPVSVRVAVVDEALDLEIVNPVPAGATDLGGGRGLAGMRERVALLGGAMSAGPEPGRWRVAVRLPLDTGRVRRSA